MRNVNNRSGALVAGLLAVCLVAVSMDPFSDETPEERAANVLKERAQIDARCEKWDLSHSERNEYDWHSGARREGCRAASLIFSRVTYEENRKEGERLWSLINPPGCRTESAHYAYMWRFPD